MYEFTSRVRYSECSTDYRLSLAGLVNYMQDCAAFHSENVGRGGQMLKKEDKAWMIMSWRIKVNRYADYGEKIAVRTWGYSFKGLEALRNFTIKDMDGDLLAYADSRWCYFDTEIGRPIRVPDEETEAYGIEPPLPMDQVPRHIKLPETGYTEKGSFKVRTIHLDSNGHVNNEQYISMALAYLPAGIKVRELRVGYYRQAHLGDVITPKVYHKDGEYIVWLEMNGNPCTAMQFFV